MVLQLLYAASEYLSFEQFSACIPELETSPNYAMAKLAAIPVSPLATKVMAKFHHDTAQRSVSVDELAQLEFVDIPLRQRSVLDSYMEGLYGHHMGRVSVVPAGEMIHSYIEQLAILEAMGELKKSLGLAIQTSGLGKDDIGEIAEMMNRYTDGGLRLTEFRQHAGFSLFENVAYGVLVKGLYFLPSIFLGIDHVAAGANPQRVEAIRAKLELYHTTTLICLDDRLAELDDPRGPNRPFMIEKLGVRDRVHLR